MLAVLQTRDCTLLHIRGHTKAGSIHLTMPGKQPGRIAGCKERLAYHVGKQHSKGLPSLPRSLRRMSLVGPHRLA